MNRQGHTIAALATAPVLLSGVEPSSIHGLIAMVGLLSGCTAPDYLEFNIIKHRTITHVLSVWLSIALYGYCLSNGYTTIQYGQLEPMSAILGAFLWGYGIGGVSHWLGDLPNKQAIPVLTPFDKVSLHLFNSGEHQKTTSLAILLLSLLVAALMEPDRFHA